MCAGKTSTRAKYISDRARSVGGMSFSEALKVTYKGRGGTQVQYKRSDLEYDIQVGYLEIVSA